MLKTIAWKANILAISYKKYGHSIPRKEICERLKNPIYCPYCEILIPVKDLSIDHIKPLSRGGSNSKLNLHLTCMSCNKMKGAFTHQEFLTLLNLTKLDTEFYRILKARLKASGGFIYRK